MIHAMYLALVVAYDMYLELEEVDINQTWKDKKKFQFWKCCVLISNHMLKYNLFHRQYVGGTNMRPATQQNQSTRYNSKDDARC